jgi:DNA-binding response OmpR family regulator
MRELMARVKAQLRRAGMLREEMARMKTEDHSAPLSSAWRGSIFSKTRTVRQQRTITLRDDASAVLTTNLP